MPVRANSQAYWIELRSRLRRIDSDYMVTKQFIKMKFSDFSATTVERQMVAGLPAESFDHLCDQAWERGARPVRLLGIGVRLWIPASSAPPS